jgi:cation:H+ antiporter
MIALKLIFGLALLVVGAEVLVKGASKIAAAIGITPLVIGLTVVAFGTSSPELAVSVVSSLEGKSDIALGNVLGSNIFNVLFILGLSALITPLVVAQQLIRLDVPIMIGASLLTLLFAWDGNIATWEGAILMAIGIAYIVFVIRLSRKEKNKAVLEEYKEEYGEQTAPAKGKLWLSILFVVAGLLLLVLGSRWLVESAVVIAKSLGVSDLVVGLTIIAAGTSLPEVATSIIASMRGEKDIAVGNVVGSNIFNIFFILSTAAVVSKGGVPVAESALKFDLPVMVAVAVACLPIFLTGRRIDRWEGAVFLGYYIAYTIYLILASQRHASLEAYSNAMIWFVIPITVLTLGIVTAREARKKR